MRRFIINVNGKSYDVAVQEVEEGAQASVIAAPAAVSSPKVTEAAPEKVPAPAAGVSVPAEGTKLEAPMPGQIVQVKVSVGDQVKEGDVLFILEAMKLENELLAPCTGKVASINTSKGTTVNTGELLAVIS